MYWYVLLIIITVVGFFISILLNLLFVYFPGQRAANKFDDIQVRGTKVIENSKQTAEEVSITAELLTEFSIALCEGVESNNGQLLTAINASGIFDDFCSTV